MSIGCRTVRTPPTLFPHILYIPPTNTIAAKLYNRAAPLASQDWFLYIRLLPMLLHFSLTTI
jgi:hypothetical protein